MKICRSELEAFTFDWRLYKKRVKVRKLKTSSRQYKADLGYFTLS